jgi:hypothetical protein
MKISYAAGAVLAVTLMAGQAFAQDGAKQDMKDAGHSTANATKSAGSGIKKGTVKGAEATKHGTAVGATKTARGTKKVGKAIVGDKSPTTTPHDPPKPVN